MFWSYRKYFDLWMPGKEVVTNRGPLMGLVQRNNDEIGVSVGNHLDDLRLIFQGPEDLNVRLIRDGSEDQISHEARVIGD
jgi:hypothetical protein